VKDRR